MMCALCGRVFDHDKQSPSCPHEILDAPISRPGGPRLRIELQHLLDEAFALRDKEYLQFKVHNSLNFAERYYAGHMLKRLEELEKAENV